jgi:hypothetical protein
MLVIGVLAALYLLGRWGQQDERAAAPAQVSTPAPRKAKAHARRQRRRRAPAPTRAAVRLTAVRTVYVCLIDAGGRAVVNRVTLQPGQSTGTYRSKWFRGNFGNGAIRVRVNGRSFTPAASNNPVGYEIRPKGPPRRLPEAVRRGLCA